MNNRVQLTSWVRDLPKAIRILIFIPLLIICAILIFIIISIDNIIESIKFLWNCSWKDIRDEFKSMADIATKVIKGQ